MTNASTAFRFTPDRRRSFRLIYQSVIAFVFVMLLAVNTGIAQEVPRADQVRKLLQPFMQTITGPDNKVDENQVSLGRSLFYDHRLSGDSTYSCNSCHDLTKYGTGGDYFLKQKEQGKVFRDVPSLYNLKNQSLFGWAGTHKSLPSKIEHSFLSAHEMKLKSPDELRERLEGIVGYKALFEKAFPQESPSISAKTVSAALQAFIHGLVTPAPIDRFLSGDDQALTPKQLAGAVAFDQNKCFSCHTGELFGGHLIMKLGVVEAWPNQQDTGYFEVSKNPDHLMCFRVASLRNAEKTAPYFHDHSSKRLWDAIGKMGRFELGQQLSLEDLDHLQEFIKSMTGDIPSDYIKKPELP